MLLVGNFPFNSFLSGFLCHIGLFALAGKFHASIKASYSIAPYNSALSAILHA
jgi:hypothetical protein